jgi:hypothetical protein
LGKLATWEWAGKTRIDAGNLNKGIYNISLQSYEEVVNKWLVVAR